MWRNRGPDETSYLSQANRWGELVERDGPHEAMALILTMVNEHLGINRDWYA